MAAAMGPISTRIASPLRRTRSRKTQSYRHNAQKNATRSYRGDQPIRSNESVEFRYSEAQGRSQTVRVARSDPRGKKLKGAAADRVIKIRAV